MKITFPNGGTLEWPVPDAMNLEEAIAFCDELKRVVSASHKATGMNDSVMHSIIPVSRKRKGGLPQETLVKIKQMLSNNTSAAEITRELGLYKNQVAYLKRKGYV
jgi:hypothetical protein